jgi:cyclopropane fatty-acyl-phospholipid synthase-like methyltransferase
MAILKYVQFESFQAGVASHNVYRMLCHPASIRQSNNYFSLHRESMIADGGALHLIYLTRHPFRCTRRQTFCMRMFTSANKELTTMHEICAHGHDKWKVKAHHNATRKRKNNLLFHYQERLKRYRKTNCKRTKESAPVRLFRTCREAPPAR